MTATHNAGLAVFSRILQLLVMLLIPLVVFVGLYFWTP